MPDQNSKREPADLGRINVHEEWELVYWAKLLGTNEKDLREAVIAVGAKTDAVRMHLGKRQSQA